MFISFMRQQSYFLWIALLFSAVFSAKLASEPVSVCPEGYYHIDSLKLCLSPGLTSKVYQNIPKGYACPDNYARYVNLTPCLLEGIILDIHGEYTVLHGHATEYCPQGFPLDQISELCVNANLALDLLKGALTLVNTGPICDGPSATECLEPLSKYGLPSWQASKGECQVGYIKSPDLTICSSIELAKNGHVDLPQSTRACPPFFHRETQLGRCVPENRLHVCGEKFPCEQNPCDSVMINTNKLICGEGFVETQIDIPLYDKTDGNTIPVLACTTRGTDNPGLMCVDQTQWD